MSARPFLGFQSSHFSLQSCRSRALTLVEMLIVIIVIGILVSAILVASAGLINKSRTNNTRSVLTVVSEALEQFKRDQSGRPTISSARQPKKPGEGDLAKNTISYSDRYGAYPPDELEVFTPGGLPGSTGPANVSRSLAPGKAQIIATDANPPWEAMRYFKDGADLAKDRVEHRDLLAMILAIETLSESGSAILDRIPDRNRTSAPLDGDKPAIFLSRPDPGDATINTEWDSEFDSEVRFIVDDWGIPLSYLAQRDWKEDVEIPSSNHEDWNEASTELIRLNGGVPVLFSYGPNGADQLTKDIMGDKGTASLVGDFEDETLHGVIDNPLNYDNVYAKPELREKLAKGIE